MLHEDKRDFFRMLVNCEAQITLLDSEAGRDIDAVCRDLSGTGMALEIDEPLEIATQLKVKLESSNNGVPTLDAVAKVVRCHEVEDKEYLVGLEILEIN